VTWIRTADPGDDPEVAKALRAATAQYPSEYSPERRHERDLPPAVMDDSIILVHSLIPAALEHLIGGYGALMAADLPLSRREHEMIAATTSRLNQCFY
jgi:hypothetical protein